MMQDGLHIGLAAWIDAQREAGGFTTWPALPLLTKLVDLEAIQTMHDLARAAEFARMVNFTPRKGQYAEPFSPTGVIWDSHIDILGRMEFAVRAWTAEEDAEWRAARDKLYETRPDGSKVMTRAFKLYDEFRIAYADLAAAGADPAELVAAHAAWVLEGSKLEIEAALATIDRLSRRSSLSQAEFERLALTSELDMSADRTAATAFSPLSAVREESWLSAEATFDELEQAVGAAEPRAKWTAWRAARTGSVRFRYAVLDIRRSWFTPSLYEADDWRLDEGEMASRGDSASGDIPAYVRSVYLVKIDDLRTEAQPSTGTGPSPRPRPFPWPRPFPRPIEAVLGSGQLKSLSLSAVPRKGVAATAVTRVAAGAVLTPQPVATLALATRAPNLMLRNARFGRLQQVTMLHFANRVLLAEAVISAQPPPPPTPAHVVGFGCTGLPASPTPNLSYQW